MRKFSMLLLLGLCLPEAGLAQIAGKLVSAIGRVEVQAGGQGGFTPAANNQTLNTGDAIRTGSQSRAAILLADETQLKLNANTQLQLTAVRQTSNLLVRVAQAGARADQSILNMASGQAALRARKTPADVRVNTPAVTAAIRGTEFDLKVADDGESVITVVDGSVDYRNDQGFVLVNSGEQGRARIGQAPTKIIILNPQDAVQWTLFYSGTVSPRDYPFLYASVDAARGALAGATGDPVRLAQTQHDAGDNAAALTTLQGVTSPQASETRGWVLLEQNRIGDAIRELGQAPVQSARTRLGLSLAHYRLNEFVEAYNHVKDPGDDGRLKFHKAMLDLIAGDAETSRSLLLSVPAGDASYPLAQGLLSNVYLTQNNKDEALAAAQRAVQANAGSPSAHFSLSIAQQSFFDLPAATRSAETALRLDPNFLQGQVQYAKLLYGAGNSARAEEVVRRALAVAPEEAAAHSLLGFILLGQAKTDVAGVAFETSIRQDSTRGEPHLGLGIVHMRRGKPIDAEAEMLLATTLEPQIALYQSYLGKAFYEERKFEQAFTALADAIKLDPRDPTPHLYSGIFRNDLSEPGAAVKSFQESIRLNDNRAVYRSRFVLDEDRATRNVSLATSFNRLGLSEWANSEAIKSNLADPANSSARLFLAGTFLNLPGRTLAAGGELLLTRLLLPVNSNSFNAFNDYTTLFELPRINWTAEQRAGLLSVSTPSFSTEHRSDGETVISSGGSQRFAFTSSFLHNFSEGLRPVNDDSRDYSTVNIFKFALTAYSDFLLYYSHLQTRSGDHGAPVLISGDGGTAPISDPMTGNANNDSRRIFSRLHRAEIGYHVQLRPGSDVVIDFSAQSTETVFDTPDARTVLRVRFDQRDSIRSPFLNLQAEHLLKVSRFQFKYGGEIYEGRFRGRRVLHDTRFRLPNGLNYAAIGRTGGMLYADPDQARLDAIFKAQRVRFKTAFLQADYVVSPRLILTAGLSYQWSNDNNIFDDTDERRLVEQECQSGEQLDRATGFCRSSADFRREPAALYAFPLRFDRATSYWNPQGGVLFTPLQSTTFRFAAMRVLQGHPNATLAPTHINGFLLGQNELELTRSSSYSFGWDQRYGKNAFVRATAHWRERETPIYDFLNFACPDDPRATCTLDLPANFVGHFYGSGIVWNQFLTERLTFVPEYSLVRDEGLGFSRHDDLVRFGVFYVDPHRYAFEYRASYLNQRGIVLQAAGSVPIALMKPSHSELGVWTTDVAFSYELARKKGLLSFKVLNLFDRRYQFLADPLSLDPRVPARQLSFLLRMNF
ncbi:MAG: FecR domain-containing protein [Acidobacteria bacterium]|nr:FecR domain-containing protein [Acidobacteriota bacterium]